MVTKKRKTTKRRARRSSPVDSMERTMEATTRMVGTVAIAGMGIGLVGGMLGAMNK